MKISKSVFFLSFIFFLLSVEVNANVIRAAIDFGTGGPKIRIAEIDSDNKKIIKQLHSQQFPVNFQTALSRDRNNCITEEMMEEGLIAFKKAIAVAHEYEVDGIVTVGASLFRIAANAQEFADYIHFHTNIHVHIIDQSTEALLAYQAAIGLIDADPKNVVVCDVGGGSTQFTGIDENGFMWIKNLNYGSGDFRDYVIENIQGHLKSNCLSPNPLSEQDCIKAVSYARSLCSGFNNAIDDVSVIGVGSVFSRGVASWVGNQFTQERLRLVVNELTGMTDADLGGPFPCVEVTNLILVLGFMDALNITEMTIKDVNNADGALVNPEYW